ncbi:unnamed protein product, partial [marine sediment metagenome]
MVDEVKLDIKITVPTSVEVAGDMPDKWADGLTNNAERMNDRRIAKIPDEGTFQSKVAVPSTNKFSPMIDSAFESNSGRNQANIIRAQYKNLANSFDDWDAKLALAFATVDGVVAKRFVDQVNNSKDRWATAVAAKTLRATGDKIRGTILGQACYWLTGDYRANQMTNHLELVAGAPYDYTYYAMKGPFKAGFMGKIVQALIMILNADFLAAEITAQNTRVNALCQIYRDTVVAPVKSFIVGGGATDSLAQFEYA